MAKASEARARTEQPRVVWLNARRRQHKHQPQPPVAASFHLRRGELDRQSLLARTARAKQHKPAAPFALKPLVQGPLQLLPRLQPIRRRRHHIESQQRVRPRRCHPPTAFTDSNTLPDALVRL